MIEGRDSFILRQIWIVLHVHVVHIDNRNTKGSQFQSDTQLSPKPLYLFSGLAVKKEYLKELYSIVAQFLLFYM